MGAPSGGSLAGKQVAKLPAPEHDDRQVWPYFAVADAARKLVVTQQGVQKITLEALKPAAHTVPLQPLQPPSPPKPVQPPPPPQQQITIPPGAKRFAVPGGSTQAAPTPPTGAPQPQLQPRTAIIMNPAASPATVPLPGFGTVAPPTKPRRTAGPMTPSGTPAPAPAAPSAPLMTPRQGMGGAVRGVMPSPQSPSGGSGLRARGTSAPAKQRAIAAARLATAALVLGLLGILLPIVAGVAAIVCGHWALGQADPIWTPEQIKRRAQWGLALGYLTTILWLGFLVFVR